MNSNETISIELRKDLSEIKALIALEEPSAALPFFNKFIEQQAMSDEIFNLLFRAYMEVGNLKDAEITATHWNASSWSGARSQRALFLALQDSSPESAHKAIQDAIALDGDNGEYWGLLGRFLAKTRGMEDSETAFTRAKQSSLRKSRGFYHLSKALYEQKKFGKSADAISESIDLETGDGEVFFHAGNVLSELGRTEDALGAYLLAALRSKIFKTSYLTGLSNCITRFFLYPAFMLEREQMLMQDLDNVENWFAFALGYEMNGLVDKALICYREIVNRAPGYLRAWQRIAALSRQRKDQFTAIAAYRAVFEIFYFAPEPFAPAAKEEAKAA